MSIRSSNASSDKFVLHPQLTRDCVHVAEMTLCRVLLMNNRHFPWLVLVPKRSDVSELFELSDDDYRQAMEEVRDVALEFARMTGAHKMNIAALGNQVPQLHIHVVARFTHDDAWPNPVWNSGVAAPYSARELTACAAKVKACLGFS